MNKTATNNQGVPIPVFVLKYKGRVIVHTEQRQDELPYLVTMINDSQTRPNNTLSNPWQHHSNYRSTLLLNSVVRTNGRQRGIGFVRRGSVKRISHISINYQQRHFMLSTRPFRVLSLCRGFTRLRKICNLFDTIQVVILLSKPSPTDRPLMY